MWDTDGILREVCFTVNTRLKVRTSFPNGAMKQSAWKSFVFASVVCCQYQNTVTANNLQNRSFCSCIQILLPKSWKNCKKKKKRFGKKKSPCKSRDQPLLRHSTKLATSTPLVLSLCPKSTYSGKSRAYITPNWALDIGRMGLLGHCFNWAFLGEFSGLLFKKENIEDRNKVAVVGCRQQEFGWIQEGVKMICRPFLLSDHLKCEWLHW